MADVVLIELRIDAEAEVVPSEHADECVAAHPNEPCPGYPHHEEQS